MNDYIPKPIKIEKVIKENSSTTTFRLLYPVEHCPGQFVMVSSLGAGEFPAFIGSYSKKYIELCLQNSFFTGSQPKPGDKLFVRGPYGSGFPMEHFQNQNLILIGAELGVIPLCSVLNYVDQNRDDYKEIDIFFGFKGERLFKNNLINWNKKYNLNLIKGDFVKFLFEKGVNKENSIALVSGDLKSISILKNLEFQDTQIYVLFEKKMFCGVGKCGVCNVSGKYICKDGPVFNYEIAKNLVDD